MRRDDNWLETLTLAHEMALKWADEDSRQRFLAALSALEKLLDATAPPRPFTDIPGLYGFHGRVARLTPDERKWAERLGERLWQAKGTGRTYAEEALLGQVGVQASPDSLPFLRAAVEANRERDSFQVKRRRLAVASVAFIARQTGDATAHAQLEDWLAHPNVTVRTEATVSYGQLHLSEKGRLKPAARAALERVAYQDRAFAPRFFARGWLHAAGIPARVEPPEGVYAFKASLGRVSRTVELLASDVLADLASSILDAFEWDHDHLYEFSLIDDLHDRRFLVSDAEEESSRVDAEAWSLPLGAFGFPKGHTFIFRYDFGDDHRFRVTVVDIQDQPRPGEKYPRVAASTGKAPEQYPFER